jgi:hypothetical protein
LGTTVFAGMLGVLFFGLLLTPVFYVLVRRLTQSDRAHPSQTPELHADESPHAPQLAAPEGSHG